MSALSLETLLRQAQALLRDADEANHGGYPVTYDLQRQARELLAEAIDANEAAGDQEAQRVQLFEAHALIEAAKLALVSKVETVDLETTITGTLAVAARLVDGVAAAIEITTNARRNQ